MNKSLNYSRWRITFAILFVLVGITSCKDQPTLMLDIQPRSLITEGKPGDLIKFYIKASSEADLKQFTITFQSSNTSDSILLDTVLNNKTLDLTWSIRIPASSIDDIQIIFKITDADGVINTDQRVIRPSYPNSLVEYNNNEMFSYTSALLNAFDVSAINAISFNAVLNDSLPANLKPDLMEFNNNPLATPFDISLQWYSPSGGKFVKASGINYSTAQRSDLVNYFNGNFNQTNKTDSLQVGDIYAFQSKPTSPGSFFCLLRIDQINYNGTVPASYIFSVKK